MYADFLKRKVPEAGEMACGWIIQKAQCPPWISQALLLPDGYNMLEVFNEILLIFQKFQNWERKVIDAAADSRPLKEILNLTALVESDPVYLADASLKLIEYSRPTLMPDVSAIWRYQMEYGYVPMNIVKQLIETGELKRLNTKRKAFDTPTESFNLPYTCKNIFVGNVLKAHLFLVNVYSLPSRTKLEIVERLGQLLKPYLESHPETGSSFGSFQEDYFRDIIDRKLKDITLIRSQLSYFGWEMEDTFQILVLDTGGRREDCKQFLVSYLSHQPGNECQIIEKKPYILVLYHQPREAYLGEHLTENMEQFKIRGALSAPFRSLTELPAGYEQALATLKIGKRLSPETFLYITEDYGIYRMTDQILKEHSITEVCHRGVLKLYALDCSQKTEYVETVYQYLSHDRNVLKTSRALFIHRNTLTYRLRKIETYVEVEQAPPEALHYILFSVYLLKTALRAKKSRDAQQEGTREGHVLWEK